MLFQLFREEGMDTAQVSLSKLQEFQPLFLDSQLLEASKPYMCERQEKREGGIHNSANLMLT